MSDILKLQDPDYLDVPDAPDSIETPPSKTINALRSGFRKSIVFVMLAIAIVACEPGQSKREAYGLALDACKEPLSYPTRRLEDGALSASINLLVVPVYDASQPPPITSLDADLLQEFYFGDSDSVPGFRNNSVAKFYNRNSDGNVDIQGGVYSVPVRINTKCYNEQRQGFYDDLLSAAEKSIPDFGRYNAFSFVLVDDTNSSRAWSQIGPFPEGRANAGIRANFIPGSAIEMHGRLVPIHEDGHGLRLLHASSYECPGDLPIDIEHQLPTSCVDASKDYTAMGGGRWDLDASQRRRLGATVPHETVTSTGTFFLLPKMVPSTQTLEPEQLIIPTSGGYFSLEYSVGGDVGGVDDVPGVEIRFVPVDTSSDSVVDTIRISGAPDNFNSYNLFEDGATWTDEGRGVSVRIGPLTYERATIIVDSF